MRYVDEYRDPQLAHEYADALHKITTRPWTIMEVCGGQTHAILKFGVDTLLPPHITLLHGPGCPVCVTPVSLIDKAIEIAKTPNVILTSFGDMMRVPGTHTDLLAVKAGGGDVRMVYSPLDALKIAQATPDKQVVFFAVGFETTTPTTALTVHLAKQGGVTNFSLLVAHVLVPPAVEAILSAPQRRVHGFLAAGHVCTVMGYHEYIPLAEKYGVPFVVTGFEPLDILQGILMCVRQLEEGRAEVENQYARAVQQAGNTNAQNLLAQVFMPVHRAWRGIGTIPLSGVGLRPEYADFDAERRFGVADDAHDTPTDCLSGQVLQGIIKPDACPAFGTTCTPEHPLGATMVSNEGACAAYYRYRKDVITS